MSEPVPVRVFYGRAIGRPQGTEPSKAKIAEQGWTWLVFFGINNSSFLWVCPGCGHGFIGDVGPVAVGGWDGNARWRIHGPPDALSAEPSLGCREWKDGRCTNGHWMLLKGLLVPV